MFDASARGSMNTKIAEEARVLVETMASNENQVEHERGGSSGLMSSQQKRGIVALDTQDALLAQNKIITQQLENLTKQMNSMKVNSIQAQPWKQVLQCDFCQGDHENRNVRQLKIPKSKRIIWETSIDNEEDLISTPKTKGGGIIPAFLGSKMHLQKVIKLNRLPKGKTTPLHWRVL